MKCDKCRIAVGDLCALCATGSLLDSGREIIGAVMDKVFSCEHCEQGEIEHDDPASVYCNGDEDYHGRLDYCPGYQRKTKGE